MKYYLKVFKDCLDFQGRASQSEFWFFFLFNILFSISAKLLDSILDLEIQTFRYGPIYQIYTLIVLFPGIAVTVRRLHDTGRSGWFIFIVLIPFIGIIWLIYVLAGESHPGMNQYGEKPKEKKIPKTVKH